MNQILGLGIIVIGIFFVLSLMRSNNEANSNEDFHAAQQTVCKNRFASSKLKQIETKSDKLSYNQAIAKCKKDNRCHGLQIRGWGGNIIKGGPSDTEYSLKNKGMKSVFTAYQYRTRTGKRGKWYLTNRSQDKGPNKGRGVAAARRAGYKVSRSGAWYFSGKRRKVVYGYKQASPDHTIKSSYVRFFGKDAPKACGTKVAGKTNVKGVNGKLRAQSEQRYKNYPNDYIYFK